MGFTAFKALSSSRSNISLGDRSVNSCLQNEGNSGYENIVIVVWVGISAVKTKGNVIQDQ
ncbi:MAG TPA: hypothetical protein V6C84_12795 [Coleofasciculaceae cyanobacterium]|jgi:hypothetical protein